DPGAVALQEDVVVELGAVADRDRRLQRPHLEVAVAGVEERRAGPAEEDRVPEGDPPGADVEDRLDDDRLAALDPPAGGEQAVFEDPGTLEGPLERRSRVAAAEAPVEARRRGR